jgi:tetratricopeptide (TPR) repeat protein
MMEERVKEFLTELLMDVPIARKQSDKRSFLDVLMRAVLFYPAFRESAPVVIIWAEEAAHLSQALGEAEAGLFIEIRRAVIDMRLLNLDEALRRLTELPSRWPDMSDRGKRWRAVTLSRVHTRRQQFDLAAQFLSEASGFRLDEQDWVAVLTTVARGELQLERNEVATARDSFLTALYGLPFELIEERVQVLQSLGFIYISEADAKNALLYLDQARQLLIGASAWSEATQMSLVVGNLKLTFGEVEQARQIFTEALDVCEQYPQPELEPMLRLGLARAEQGEGKYESAIQSVLEAAKLFANRGQALGFIAMILYLSRIHLEAKNYREAYRTLATGIAVAKHLSLPGGEAIFRAQVNSLREDILGPEKFDEMVTDMIREMEEQRSGKESADSNGPARRKWT